MKKLVSIMLIIACAFSLFACSDPASDSTPSEVVSSALDSFKNKQFDKMDDFFEAKINMESNITFDGKLDSAENQISKLFLDRITDIDYAILEETISEDNKSATVIVKLTTHNLAEKLLLGAKDALPLALNLAFNKTPAEEVSRQLFSALLTPLSQSEKTNIHTITIALRNTGSGWKIGRDNSEFLNSMTGGFTNILNQFNFLY